MERFWHIEQNESVQCPHFRKVLTLLGSGPHVEILEGLATGEEQCVGDLAERLKMHPDCASAGLRKLRALGLLTVRRVKKHHFYRLSRGFKVAVTDRILEIVIASLDGATVHLVVPRDRVSLPV